MRRYHVTRQQFSAIDRPLLPKSANVECEVVYESRMMYESMYDIGSTAQCMLVVTVYVENDGSAKSSRRILTTSHMSACLVSCSVDSILSLCVMILN